MMQLEVRRKADAIGTPGGLYCVSIDGSEVGNRFLVYTLEPPEHRDVFPAIPDGQFRLTIEYSPRFRRQVPHIYGVPGRTAIEIHPGNTTEDTEGCTLVGQDFTGDVLLRSQEAFAFLMGFLQSDDSDKMIRYIDSDPLEQLPRAA